jgi:hypothetical protein
MITSAGRNVNWGSYGPLLGEFLLDPPSHGDERVERSLADVDAGQLVETFEVFDDMMQVGAAAHVGDSQETHQLRLGHEFGKANGMEFFIHGDLPCGYRS